MQIPHYFYTKAKHFCINDNVSLNIWYSAICFTAILTGQACAVQNLPAKFRNPDAQSKPGLLTSRQV